MNSTIIVNHTNSGFGCDRACSHCNWRDSIYLPHGEPDYELLNSYVRQSQSHVVTISGGGDPLHDFKRYGHRISKIAEIINRHNKRVRIITRQVDVAVANIWIADQWSFSLDVRSRIQMTLNRSKLNKFNAETSVVLPPIPTEAVEKLMPQYTHLQQLLKVPLLLRENLNSIHTVDPRIVKGASDISFVSRELCRSGSYFLNDTEMKGYELFGNIIDLMNAMDRSDVYLIGGFMKHRFNSEEYLEYDDIDIVCRKTPGWLLVFGYSEHRAVERNGARFVQYRSSLALPAVHAIYVDNPYGYIADSQFSIDRAFMLRGKLEAIDPRAVDSLEGKRIDHYQSSKFHDKLALDRLLKKYHLKGYNVNYPQH